MWEVIEFPKERFDMRGKRADARHWGTVCSKGCKHRICNDGCLHCLPGFPITCRKTAVGARWENYSWVPSVKGGQNMSVTTDAGYSLLPLQLPQGCTLIVFIDGVRTTNFLVWGFDKKNIQKFWSKLETRWFISMVITKLYVTAVLLGLLRKSNSITDYSLKYIVCFFVSWVLNYLLHQLIRSS